MGKGREEDTNESPTQPHSQLWRRKKRKRYGVRKVKSLEAKCNVNQNNLERKKQTKNSIHK